MDFENPLTFVRSLEGAPASIFLALMFARHPMTNRELQRWTGYSAESIAQAARLLSELGWVTSLGPRGPWTLSDGRQLPLMPLPDLGALPEEEDERPVLGGEELPVEEEDPRAEQEDRNFVLSLHALYDAGIHEPTAGRLARLPHVNPEYIRAHVERANAEGFTLGIAIYRIEHAWPVPAVKRVLTVEERIQRFIEQDR